MEHNLQVGVRKETGHYQRVIHLIFQNIGEDEIPRTSYFLKVKEGSKTVNELDSHEFGPLAPGEIEEQEIKGALNTGWFIRQKITVKTLGNIYEMSVDMFT